MAWGGWGGGEGASPAPTAAQPQQRALRAGYQRGLHVLKCDCQLHLFAMRTNCQRYAAPSPLHQHLRVQGGALASTVALGDTPRGPSGMPVIHGARIPPPHALGARGLPWSLQGREPALTTGHGQPGRRSRLFSPRGNAPGDCSRSQPGAKARGAAGLATSARASSARFAEERGSDEERRAETPGEERQREGSEGGAALCPAPSAAGCARRAALSAVTGFFCD